MSDKSTVISIFFDPNRVQWEEGLAQGKFLGWQNPQILQEKIKPVFEKNKKIRLGNIYEYIFII